MVTYSFILCIEFLLRMYFPINLLDLQFLQVVSPNGHNQFDFSSFSKADFKSMILFTEQIYITVMCHIYAGQRCHSQNRKLCCRGGYGGGRDEVFGWMKCTVQHQNYRFTFAQMQGLFGGYVQGHCGCVLNLLFDTTCILQYKRS